MTLHFTNKKTNEVFGYESIEDAKKYNKSYRNLVEMTEEQFIDFRDNHPLGCRWTYKGWVIDPELLAEAEAQEELAKKAELNRKISELKLQLQVHLLMGEEEDAKALVLEIRALQK